MTGSKKNCAPESADSGSDARELEVRALRARVRQLEDRIDRIHASRLWRWSAPLRALGDVLIRSRQRLGRSLISTAAGRRLYRRIRGRAPGEESAREPGFDRRAFVHRAEQDLDEFLSSGQRLVLPRPDPVRVSIVVVLFNQAALSLRCFRSILAHAGDQAELVVIDNASTDRTGDLLERVDGIERVVNSENLGFVHAVNQAASRARGELLLLLNNDAELGPGSLEAAIAALQSAEDIGAVGGRIVLADGRLQEAGGIVWKDGSTSGYGRGCAPEEPRFLFRREVDYCSGAFLLTPARLFAEFDGFDTAYAPAYYEETDYCFRLQQADYRIVYEPWAWVRHLEFASSSDPEAALKLQARHRKVFSQRHAGALQDRPEQGLVDELLVRTARSHRKVLWIDDRVPHASLGAGYPRARRMLNTLAENGFDLTLYPLQIENDDWSRIRASLDPGIEVMTGLGIERLGEFLNDRRGFYDRVVVSRPINMKVVNTLLQGRREVLGKARLIYDAEAIEAEREIQRQRMAGQSLSQDRVRRMLAEEIELSRMADAVITVSEVEAEVFRAAGHKHVAVIGHALEVDLTPAAFDDRRGLLFVGALREAESPNVDALCWFLDEVADLLKSEMGDDFSLYIAGDAPVELVDRYRSDQVHFLGRVDSLEALYSACRVFIAPTRFAAGIPHKVHEAAAAGIPVVATSVLAGQLNWQHDRQLLVADQAEAFARSCARLYQDRQLWQTIRDQAAAAVAADCNPEGLVKNLVELLR